MLLKQGIVNRQANKQEVYPWKLIKISIGFDGLLVRKAKVYNKHKYAGDDEVLRETILESIKEKNKVVVFDRGLKTRQAFAEISGRINSLLHG